MAAGVPDVLSVPAGDADVSSADVFAMTESLEMFLKENDAFVQCPSDTCHFVFERTPNPHIAEGITVGS